MLPDRAEPCEIGGLGLTAAPIFQKTHLIVGEIRAELVQERLRLALGQPDPLMEVPALEEMLEETFARDGAVDVVLMLAVVDQTFREEDDAAEGSRDERQIPVVAVGLLRVSGERGERTVEDRRATSYINYGRRARNE